MNFYLGQRVIESWVDWKGTDAQRSGAGHLTVTLGSSLLSTPAHAGGSVVFSCSEANAGPPAVCLLVTRAQCAASEWSIIVVLQHDGDLTENQRAGLENSLRTQERRGGVSCEGNGVSSRNWKQSGVAGVPVSLGRSPLVGCLQ